MAAALYLDPAAEQLAEPAISVACSAAPTQWRFGGRFWYPLTCEA